MLDIGKLFVQIRDSLAIIESKQNASTAEELKILDTAIETLETHLSTLNGVSDEALAPFKDDLISIAGALESTTDRIEEAKNETRTEIIGVNQKIKAQNSYNKKTK